MASMLELTILDLPEKLANACEKKFSASMGSSEQTARFEFCRVTLCIEISDTILEASILDNHFNIPRKVIDLLRQQVRSIINAANAGRVPKNIEALAFVIRYALEVIQGFESEMFVEGDIHSKGWRADGVFDYNAFIDNSLGLDVSTVADTAFPYLKKTPQELCEAIGGSLRIIHIESVMRKDLARRFEAYRRELEEALRKEHVEKLRASMPPFSKLTEGKMRSSLQKDDIVTDMVTPRVTYHGTRLRNVGSIVRHGFKLPGSRLGNSRRIVSPRSGLAFNRGIYSSQAPFYALSYAPYEKKATPLGRLPTMRLFICATLMGQTLTKTKNDQHNLIHGAKAEGYNSHFDGSYELIVHDEAAILPCYVIHLDLGAEAAKQAILDAQSDFHEFDRLSLRTKEPHPKVTTQAPGDATRIAAAKQAAALKHFPMGFGPAGKNFVIEAIAEVDDDEEEYGEWQADRQGFYQKPGNLNQYQASRRS